VFFGEWAQGCVDTPRGQIKASWRKDGKIHVELSLPKGVIARVELPGMKKTMLTETRKWAYDIDNTMKESDNLIKKQLE